MGIEMKFEVDEQLTSSQALELLKCNGFELLEQRDDGFNLVHPNSGLVAYFTMDTQLHAPLTEGLMPPKWLCKSHMTFRYSRDNYEASKSETMKFARALASESSAYFVLSFQYENVYAVRDEKGYREISDTAATMKTPVE